MMAAWFLAAHVLGKTNAEDSFVLDPAFVEYGAGLTQKIAGAAFQGASALTGCDLQIIRTDMSEAENEVVFAVCSATVQGQNALWVSIAGTINTVELKSDVHFGEVALNESIRVMAGMEPVARFVWDYPGFQEALGKWSGPVFLLGMSRGGSVAHALHALLAMKLDAEALSRVTSLGFEPIPAVFAKDVPGLTDRMFSFVYNNDPIPRMTLKNYRDKLVTGGYLKSADEFITGVVNELEKETGGGNGGWGDPALWEPHKDEVFAAISIEQQNLTKLPGHVYLWRKGYSLADLYLGDGGQLGQFWMQFVGDHSEYMNQQPTYDCPQPPSKAGACVFSDKCADPEQWSGSGECELPLPQGACPRGPICGTGGSA